MNKKKLKVIVYSDYICPFCYIGYYRLKKLKELYNLEIEWQPFEIHPETPQEGASLYEILPSKEYVESVIASVKSLADEDKLTLTFSDKLSNSRLAHYISEFARKKGKFDEFHELVFDTYWKEGKDIGDHSLLLDLAEAIGLNKNEILSYLETDEPRNKLRKISLELKRYGINGVPTFKIGDKIIVGVQPTEVFKKVIEKVLKENAMA